MNPRTNATKLLRSAAIAGILAIVFVTAITVIADTYTPLKDWLKATFFHHWLGKGDIALALFVAVTTILYVLPQKSTDPTRMLHALAYASILGTIVLIAFFVAEAYHIL